MRFSLPKWLLRSKRVEQVAKPKPEVRLQRVLVPQANSIAGVPSEQRVSWLKERLRDIAEARRASYRAANNPRRRNTQSLWGGSGDVHGDQLTRRLIRELSRDLDRNAGAFITIHNRIEEFLVGPGVKVRPTTSDPTWNERAAKLYDDEMKLVQGGIDSRQMRSGYGLQACTVRQLFVDGDLGFLTLDDDTAQLLESDQIAGGNDVGANWSVHEGIKLNAAGAAIGFFGCPYDPDTGSVLYDQAQEFSPRDFHFAALTNRHSSTRGMPAMCGVLDDFERADSYAESEVIAAELSSQIWVTLDYGEGRFPNTGEIPNNDAQNDTKLAGGRKADGTVDWQPTTAGSALVCPDGMRANGFNPQRPNINAEPFLIFLLRQYAGNVGYSYELLFHDLRQMSWSTAKTLTDLANNTTERYQLRYLAPIFSACYKWRIKSYIARRLLPARDDWDSHEHEWPRLEQPDDQKRYAAAQLGFQTGQTSRQRAVGVKAFQIMTELAAEREHACMLAAELTKAYPQYPTLPEYFLGGMPAGTAPEAMKPTTEPADSEPEEATTT